MQVKAYVMDDMTALIGCQEAFDRYFAEYPYSSYIKKKKEIIDIEVPDHVIKKAYRHYSERVARKIVAGNYVNNYTDWLTGEPGQFYDDPLHVVFDSSTFNRFNCKLNMIVSA